MIQIYHSDADVLLERRDIAASNSGFSALTRIEIREDVRRQTLLGFGAAMTDSACCVLANAKEALRREVYQRLFSREGLGLNMARISVAASDYSRDCFSCDDVPEDVEMKHFSVAHDEEYVFPVLRDLLSCRPDLYLLSSAWSPPGWMKTGGEMTGSWMREKYIEAYAEYYFRFLKSYADHGIRISALTPQNETETDQVSRMPACFLHPEYEMKFAAVLRSKLEAAGMNPEIWIVDHNYIHWNRARWMLDCPECKKAVQGVAFHYYEGNARMLDYLHRLHPDMSFHVTEGGPDLSENYEELSCKFSVIITNALNNWCRSFVTWNAVLDENGYPNIGPYSCAGLVTLDGRKGMARVSGHYKALAHYSSFLDRGAVNVESRLMWRGQDAEGSDSFPIFHCAFEYRDGSLVAVLTNTGEKDEVMLRVRGYDYRIMLKAGSVCTVVVPR